MSSIITQERIETSPLPFGYTDLNPSISEHALRLHHDSHYAGYVDNLLRLIAGTRYECRSLEDIVLEAEEGSILNNAAQAWNHQFYFDQFSAAPHTKPSGELRGAIDRDFGSLDQFMDRVMESAAALFGSGWVWLVVDDAGGLSLVSESNAGNPIRRALKPIFVIDLWEHAYYVDYENRRAEHVKALWRVVDWSVIERRYLY